MVTAENQLPKVPLISWRLLSCCNVKGGTRGRLTCPRASLTWPGCAGLGSDAETCSPPTSSSSRQRATSTSPPSTTGSAGTSTSRSSTSESGAPGSRVSARARGGVRQVGAEATDFPTLPEASSPRCPDTTTTKWRPWCSHCVPSTA